MLLSFSLVIVEHGYVFNHLNAEKELSSVALITAIKIS